VRANRVEPQPSFGIIALERHGQLLQVDREGRERWGAGWVQGSLERISKLLVALPPADSKIRQASGRERRRPLESVTHGRTETVSDQLQRVVRPGPAKELDQGGPVSASNRSAQLAS
jgi:hypothetical protein